MKSNLEKSLSGEYVFYKNGVELYRSKNIITDAGKEVFVNYLSGQTNGYASKMVLGVGSSTPLSTDEFLSFEVFPSGIDFKTMDFTQTPSQVVFRTTIPSTFKGVIYESGLTTYGGVSLSDLNDVNDNSEIIATFDSDYESWSTTSGVSFHNNDLEGTPRLRVGDSGLEFVVPSSSSKTSTWSSVSPVESYISSDKIKVAFHVSGSVPNSISIKFTTDVTNFYTLSIPSGSISLGYNILTFNISQLIPTGEPAIGSTTGLTIVVSSGAQSTTVTMDGIRFDYYSSLTKPTLVSRSLLTEPLVIEGGYPFDIEYRLGFTI